LSPFAPRKAFGRGATDDFYCRLSLRDRAFFRRAKDDFYCRLSLRERAFGREAKDDVAGTVLGPRSQALLGNEGRGRRRGADTIMSDGEGPHDTRGNAIRWLVWGGYAIL